MSSYPLHTPPSELQGNILTPEGWISGTLHFSRYITGISGTATDPEHNKDHYILPGFIDLHVHGGAGRDIMEGGDALSAIARMHAQHGTTSLLATTMTAPVADLELACFFFFVGWLVGFVVLVFVCLAGCCCVGGPLGKQQPRKTTTTAKQTRLPKNQLTHRRARPRAGRRPPCAGRTAGARGR